MISSILGIIAGIATIAGGVIAYKNSANRQRRNAEKDIAKKEAEMDCKKDEIRQAVHANDDDKVNAIAAKLLAPCCLVFFALSCLPGCASKEPPIYIPTDRRIETVTNSLGIVCKAVPNVVFCELLEKAHELKELKTEIAVDKRLSK